MDPSDIPEGPLIWDTGVFGMIRHHTKDWERYSPLVQGHEAALSFSTVGEIRYGYYKAGMGQTRWAELEEVLKQFVVLIPTTEVVDQWARIFARLRDQLHKGGVNDIWTASCAIGYGLPVVTTDLSDFSKIAREFPQLQIIHPD